MSLNVEIANRKDFNFSQLWDMHKLRAKIFHDRRGWDVPLTDGIEIDSYDDIDPYYMMMREPGGILRGCWRLLPTMGSYMLKDTFPELLHGTPAPENEHIWELSRFAIETGGGRFGFSDIAMNSIVEIINYGHKVSIIEYVTVTTTAIERMLRRAGVVIRRFGPPIVIGVENAVALTVDIEASLKNLQASSTPIHENQALY